VKSNQHSFLGSNDLMMSAVANASIVPGVASTLKRPATSSSTEKLNSSTLERVSVSAGCSRNLMESLNQRRPSLQRLHTPFRGSNRFTRDMCCSNGSDFQSLDDSILEDEFSAMQNQKLWEKLLQFIDDISISIQNEDMEQLHKILQFDQGNRQQSPSRFFQSAVSIPRDAYLGSGFGGSKPFHDNFQEHRGPKHSGEFREVLGEIFHFFEIYFPSIRWDFKKQLLDEETMQHNGTKVIHVPKLVQEEHVHEIQPGKLSLRHMLQMKLEAERIERTENARLLQEGKIKTIQQTPLQMRCSEFCTISENLFKNMQTSSSHQQVHTETKTMLTKKLLGKKFRWIGKLTQLESP
jgi:hypothetical protein